MNVMGNGNGGDQRLRDRGRSARARRDEQAAAFVLRKTARLPSEAVACSRRKYIGTAAAADENRRQRSRQVREP